MNKKGPVIIIDDDQDDMFIFKKAFGDLELRNEIICFENAHTFLNYMRTSSQNVFFILCDINMPVVNGFDLRRLLTADKDLASISIPFLFLSTSSSLFHVDRAFTEPIQGYFVKPSSFQETKNLFKYIIDYWSHSEHPTRRMAS